VEHGRVVTIAVSGEVDLHAAPVWRAEMERATSLRTRIIVDLADTTFMDSSGLAVLQAAHHRLADDGTALVVRHPNPTVVKILRWTGLDKLVSIEQPVHRRDLPACSAR
jgi:anti-anti-sigma factor